jgi:hypothetical protein
MSLAKGTLGHGATGIGYAEGVTHKPSNCPARTAKRPERESMTADQRKEFEVDLQRAFPADYPLNLTIAPCDCEECAELRQDFAEYTWIDLPASIIRKHYAHLSLLGNEAFRYYLPALLRVAIANTDSNIAEWLMYSLAPSGMHASDLAQFSAVQRNKVVSYLDFIALDNDLTQDKVWQKSRARWQTV